MVDGEYGIRDLIDIHQVQEIFEKLSRITGIFIGFFDYPDMSTLIESGSCEICTEFHKKHSTARLNCHKSYMRLFANLKDEENLVINNCDNGMVDCAVPVVIGGKYMASLVIGQFFLEEPDLDQFRKQAVVFGFDETEYLEVVKKVSVISEKKLADLLDFFTELAQNISKRGYLSLCRRQKADQLENELKKSEERYRFLAENMADIIWTIDLSFNTTYVSPSIEKVLGFTQAERMTQTIQKMLTPESLDMLHKTFAAVMQEHAKPGNRLDTPIVMEVEYLHKNGSTLWLENTMKPLRNSADQVIGIYGVSRDISQRKEAEEEKMRLQAQLGVAQKMESLGRLAGGVAHDFNNLLTVILGHTELALQDHSLPDNLTASFVQIQHAAEDSASLTRQLLAFARKQIVQPKILDINESVDSMLKMLRRLIGEHIELVWTPGADAWPAVMDPSQIDQILVNLCINARDAIAGVGRISIETSNVKVDQSFCDDHPGIIPGNYVILSVRDNGYGIDETVMSHIFEPFFTTKGVGLGTGLGLATVYGIVKQNGGYIDVSSELSMGTAIRVYLPWSSNGKVEKAKPSSEKIPLSKGETILLVEDEKSVLEMTQTMLEGLNYRVLTASRPGDALSIVHEFEGNIHLLLTDMLMPDMSGRELVEQVYEISPSTRCLFMSGYTANSIATFDFSVHGTQFLQKPFSMMALATSIRKAMDD